MNDLITAQKAYIKALEAELNEIVSFAAAHGWKSSRAEEGRRLRAEIAKFEEQEMSDGEKS